MMPLEPPQASIEWLRAAVALVGWDERSAVDAIMAHPLGDATGARITAAVLLGDLADAIKNLRWWTRDVEERRAFSKELTPLLEAGDRLGAMELLDEASNKTATRLGYQRPGREHDPF